MSNTQINGFTKDPTINWTWNAVNDLGLYASGLKRYHVQISCSDGTVINDTSTTNSYTQHGTVDGKSYTCTVRAEDNVGNIGGTSFPSATIKVDQSAPGITLLAYPLHIIGDRLTFKWNAVTDPGSGLDEYEVALTASDQNPDQAQPLERTTTTETSYTFITKVTFGGRYYAWVRAKDILGNTSPNWIKAGPFPDYTIQGPADKSYNPGEAIRFGVTSTSGTGLRFRVWYKTADTQSSPYDSSSVTLDFPTEDQWQWWLEIYEGDDPDPQTTEKFSFTVDKTAPAAGSNSFRIESRAGDRIYDNGDHPANTASVKLSGITLYDAGSGIKELYFWNGDSQTPSANAVHKTINESQPDNGPWQLGEDIEWTLSGGDELKTVSMQVIDNAGNATVVGYQLLLDTTPPAAPEQNTFKHITSDSQITFIWQIADPGNEISQFKGWCALSEDTTDPDRDLTITRIDGVAYGSHVFTVPAHRPNQPVVLTVYSVDKAGNPSSTVTYTAYTKAALGSLQNLDGGYNPVTQQFFLSWQLSSPDSGAGQYILEYGDPTADNGLTVKGVLTPDSSGQFIHSGLIAHGSYSYRLVALNGSSDRTEGAIFLRQVPNTAPSAPELKSPLSFARAQTGFAFLPATDVDGDNISYNLYIKAANAQQYTEYLNVISGMEIDGLIHGQTYDWYVEADDSYEHGVTKSAGKQFTVDSAAPTLRIEPARYPYTSQSRLAISAGDDLSGIDKVSFTKISATTNETIDSGTIDLSDNGDGAKRGVIQLTEGNYHLHFTVFDKAGNSTPVEVNNLKVDQTAPEISDIELVLQRDGGGYLSAGQLPLRFSASDNTNNNQSGISTLRYRIASDQNADLGSGQSINLSPNLQQFSQIINLSGVNGQSYYLVLAVEDAAGNRSPVIHLGPLVLDTTAPEASLILGGPVSYGSGKYLGDQSNLSAACNASDAESGIAGSQFVIIDAASGQAVSAWGAWDEVKQMSLTPGTAYRVAVKVTNKVGLTTAINSEKFSYDNSAPQDISLSGPITAVATGEQISFTLNAADAESPIVEYRLDIESADGRSLLQPYPAPKTAGCSNPAISSGWNSPPLLMAHTL